jgi:hypothetical protein
VQSLILPLALFDSTEARGMWYTVACADRADTDPNAADYSQLVPRLKDNAANDAADTVATCKA